MLSDGSGVVTGTDSISYDGNTVKRRYDGTYIVNEDCTGTLEFRADDDSVTNADFVIVNDGKEISLVLTDRNYIVSGELKQQKSKTQTTSSVTSPR